MNYRFLSVSRFVKEMGRRVIPSPAAGSSLALSLAMGCSLLELLVSEMREKNITHPNCKPTEDETRLRQWRRRGEEWIDADIRAVETMMRQGKTVPASTWLQPMYELAKTAGEAAELAIAYLPVRSEKQSDTLVAFLHFRTAYWGACQIVVANTTAFRLSCPLPADWRDRLQAWDQEVSPYLTRM